MNQDENYIPFSKRYGHEPAEIPFQIAGIDATLRTELWNAFHIFIQERLERNKYNGDAFRSNNRYIWVHFFKIAIDDFPDYDYEFGRHVRKFIETGPWYKVYEFFEFMCRLIDGNDNYELNEFRNYLNHKLRENNSGYTLINCSVVPVTNETEVAEIREVQELAKEYNLSGITEHLNSSLALLSKKPTPDYRNSIKESISMVEVICRMIEPSENTLGKALNRLDRNQKINSTLKSGFEKLYAYTNDKNGIRHAVMEEAEIDLEDARFFLVSCSAFTNYLIEKAKKGGVVRQHGEPS